MICEWLTEDGKIATYDTATGLFVYLNLDRSPLEAPREATAEEIIAYQERYPAVEVDAQTAPTREQLLQELSNTLTVLRGITGDQVVTSNEINTAFGIVVPSLQRLRDYGPQLDDDLVYLVVLVLSQLCMSLFIMASQIGAGYRAIADPQIVLRNDLNTLAETVNQLRIDFDTHEHP